MPDPLMSKLRSPLRLDEGAHLASGRVSDRFGLMPRLPCRTAAKPLAALVGRWPRLPASRDTVGCFSLAAPAMQDCLKPSSRALEPRMAQGALGTLRDQRDSIPLHARRHSD